MILRCRHAASDSAGCRKFDQDPIRVTVGNTRNQISTSAIPGSLISWNLTVAEIFFRYSSRNREPTRQAIPHVSMTTVQDVLSGRVFLQTFYPIHPIRSSVVSRTCQVRISRRYSHYVTERLFSAPGPSGIRQVVQVSPLSCSNDKNASPVIPYAW